MKFIIRSGFTLVLALVLLSPLHAQSTEPAEGKKMMMEGKMKESCQEMKAKKEQMMAEMKAQNAELIAQVSRMNNAPENEKPALMAALVTRLAEERVSRDARRAKMEMEMMQHMMRHMQMGKDSMAACPMIKDMGNMDAKTNRPDTEHHEMEKK